MTHPLRSTLEHVEPESSLHSVLIKAQTGFRSEDNKPILGNTSCLLADIGDFVIFVNQTLSQLVTGLVDGQHIELYNTQRFNEMVAISDFSDFSPLDYLEYKHGSLKALQREILLAHQRIVDIWNSSPPLYFSSESISNSDHSSEVDRLTRQIHAFSDPSRNFGQLRSSSTSFSAMEFWSFKENQTTDLVSLQNRCIATSPGQISRTGPLSLRGTGQWVCPFGESCDKGGVDTAGKPRIFVANSAFNAHMQKHEKPFKCKLPDCPNRGGFATKFQLQRHEKKVKHTLSP